MALSPKREGSDMLCRLWVCNSMRFRFIFYQDITRVPDKENSLCQLPRSGWPVDRAGLGSESDLPCLSCTWAKQGRRSWSFYIWTICFLETNGQKRCSSLIAFTRISVYRLDNRWVNVKRPRPTALKDYMHRLGRVAHFVRNPALPTDQPLRGSWWDSHSCFI